MRLRTAWLLLLGVLPMAAAAEALPDPTRPPGGLFVTDGQNAEPVPSGLQSVIIAPGRRAAIINGQTVELGEKIGDARLVSVTEHEVVLRGKHGKQVMTMFPGVTMRPKTVPKSLVARPLATEEKSEQKAAADDLPQEGK